ncbi:hypothetical protein P9112_009556 [Eukaryota sp. TZLM1-RC]
MLINNQLQERNEALSSEFQTVRVESTVTFEELGQRQAKFEDLEAELQYFTTLAVQLHRENYRIRSGSQLNEENDFLVKEMFPGNNIQKSVNLRNRNLDQHQEILVSAGLTANPHIEELDIACNNITHFGCKAFSDAIVLNSTLKILWLNRNPIGARGMVFLTKALEVNGQLIFIDLDHVMCDNSGAIALSEALKVIAGLNEIHLDFNRIDDQGGEALAEAMVVNTRVKLWLRGNSLTEGKMRELKARFGSRIRVNNPYK